MPVEPLPCGVNNGLATVGCPDSKLNRLQESAGPTDSPALCGFLPLGNTVPRNVLSLS